MGKGNPEKILYISGNKFVFIFQKICYISGSNFDDDDDDDDDDNDDDDNDDELFLWYG